MEPITKDELFKVYSLWEADFKINPEEFEDFEAAMDMPLKQSVETIVAVFLDYLGKVRRMEA